MAESLTVARPYANALYQIVENNDAASWLPLMQLCEALGESVDGRRFLNTHSLTKTSFDKMFNTVLSKAEAIDVPSEFSNFVSVLIQNKRLSLLPEIAALFISQVNKSNDTVLAEITSAMPLSDDSKNKLLDKLTAKYNKKIEASIVIDASLIGGAIIRIGDTVIDGSVKGRLEQLTKALN